MWRYLFKEADFVRGGLKLWGRLASTPHHLKCLALLISYSGELAEQFPIGFMRFTFQLCLGTFGGSLGASGKHPPPLKMSGIVHSVFRRASWTICNWFYAVYFSAMFDHFLAHFKGAWGPHPPVSSCQTRSFMHWGIRTLTLYAWKLVCRSAMLTPPGSRSNLIDNNLAFSELICYYLLATHVLPC